MSAPLVKIPTYTGRDFGNELTTAMKAQDRSQISKLFEEVKQSGQLDLYFYGRFMNAWGTLKELTKVLSLWEEMEKKDIKPTLITYGVMLKVCCNCRQADLAMSYFAKMQQGKITPDSRIYTSLIGVTVHENPAKALEFARTMQQAKITAEPTLCQLLHTAIHEQKTPKLAQKILNILYVLGGPIIDNTIIMAHNHIIHRATRCKQLDIALEVYRLAEANHVAPTRVTYNSMLQAFVRAGKFEEGVTFIQENMKLPPDSWTFNLIIKEHAKRGQIPAVYTEIDKMVALGINPTDRTCNSLLYAYVQAGKIEEGRQVFAKETAKWKLTADQVTLDILVKGYKHDIAKIDALFDDLQITPKPKTVEFIIETATSCDRQDLVEKYTEILTKCAQ